jgi:hypothetical protein
VAETEAIIAEQTSADREHFLRCEDRKATNWLGLIKLPDGGEIPTTVKDISPSGAKLTVLRTSSLPDHFLFKVFGREFICAVQVVWLGRHPNHDAGPAFLKPIEPLRERN